MASPFAKNRAEELGIDVSGSFVIPPFFSQLDLMSARKPRVIVGGRGCGKTMLLRYLAYQTQFSPAKDSVSIDEFRHIGLYWKIDTQSARIMSSRGREDWHIPFEHLIALEAADRILSSIEHIADTNNNDLLKRTDLGKLDFRSLSDFEPNLNGDLFDLHDQIGRLRRSFVSWIRNVNKSDEPHFLPAREFLVELIARVRASIPSLSDAIFFIYVDEFESLLPHQQEVMNTLIKHSEAPLIFNVAMKRNGFQTRRTVGNESITDVSDYRTHDLEEYLQDKFELFAAEVLLLNLSQTAEFTNQIDIRLFQDANRLLERETSEYRSGILDQVSRMLPGSSHGQIAAQVLSDSWAKNRLKETIEKGLKKHGSALSPDLFLDQDHAEASVVSACLLHRDRVRPEDVAEEFEKLRKGEANRFSGGWIHNFLVGCILLIYNSKTEPCPIYAGFSTFCLMSRGNLRHLLELCHNSINRRPHDVGSSTIVDQRDQALAARAASKKFLTETKSFGSKGNRLHTLVMSLGSLFALSQSRDSQSEPERAHFAITRGGALDPEHQELLDDAVKWSVFFEEPETKVKDEFRTENIQYVPNPIYAPYFKITYRKGRKLELSDDEFRILASGNYKLVTALLRDKSRIWGASIDPDDNVNYPLFAHLAEDNED